MTRGPSSIGLTGLETSSRGGTRPRDPGIMSAESTVASILCTGKHETYESLARRIAACVVLPIVLPKTVTSCTGSAGWRGIGPRF
jgi:hypothetical protein